MVIVFVFTIVLPVTESDARPVTVSEAAFPKVAAPVRASP